MKIPAEKKITARLARVGKLEGGRLGTIQMIHKNIDDPLPGFMIRNKYKRSLVKGFKKTMSFRQTELGSSTDKNVRRIKAKKFLI